MMDNTETKKRQAAILLLGPTGSGKTPLGELLEQQGLMHRRCAHFDFGSHLRAVAEGRERPERLTDDDVGVIVRSLQSGALLENETFHIARDILLGFIDAGGVGDKDFIVMNGLPRHIGQAQDVDRLVQMELVIALECTPEVVRARISRNTGGDRIERKDDSRAFIEKKLEIYKERTEPLIEHYSAAGVKVARIEVGVSDCAQDMLSRIS